ncbi:hypothetical protein B0H10DRAFT_2166703 [Mycena sp. CBHHK59/15]|nr:hypothetical protein B0H10DRAFT_2166703 [Mycena sp. CBHHK59/15]
MFIPFISTLRRGGASGSSSGSSSSSSAGKSGSGSGGGKTGSSSSSSKGGSSSVTKSSPISSGGTSRSVTTYGTGGGKISIIPTGQLFGGRTEGGGTRSQVFGSRAYGSGYPGIGSRGVAARGFPFYFWPISWGTGFGYRTNGAYLYSDEYGKPNNSSRPGGPMATAAFQSNSTNTEFRVVADNSTVAALITDIMANCSSYLTSSSPAAPTPFNASAADAPKPEQVVEYYRASSVALSLDGYNNTAIFAAENTTADVALPSGIDVSLLDCLNQTIGLAVPLVDRAGPTLTIPGIGIVGFVWLLSVVRWF